MAKFILKKMLTFKQFINESFWKNQKTRVGHSLPTPVRKVLASAPVIGKIVQGKIDKNLEQSNKHKKILSQIWSHNNLPKVSGKI